MRLRSFVLFLAGSLLAPALRAQAPAEVLLSETRFTMKSPVEAVEEVHEIIQVNKQSGLETGCFEVYSDDFRTLSSFSGSISVGGKVIRKLRKADLITELESDALIERVYVNAFEPLAPYPFVVEYNYTVTHRKAIAAFPTFMPVPDYEVPVRAAGYTLTVPAQMEIQYRSSAEPKVETDGETTKYQWSFKDLEAIPHEHSMPAFEELMPYVFASPFSFEYMNYPGFQRSWEDVSRWYASILPSNPVVPAAVRNEILSRTESCTTDLEKVRVVYDYLREHTRYVSIQLGIGGHVPTVPERVAATGFGDCKALSFYMQQLLAVLGIPSDYLIINTRRRSFPEGYASLGQMNHAMLRVPLAKDTLWVECTNPMMPLGYRHSSAAGHQVVLIGKTEGRMVRIPDYPDSLRREENRLDVVLAADGSAKVTVCRSAWLDEAESYIGFRDRKTADVQRRLLSNFQGQANGFRVLEFKDNFRDYDGEPGYVPEASVRFAFDATGLARVNGDRIFVKTSPYTHSASSQKTPRRYDVSLMHGGISRDSVFVRLPEGYDVEYLPERQEILSQLADFHQTCTRQGDTVLIVSELRLKAGRLPAERYQEYRELAKTVNKAFESTLILSKKK